MAHERVAVFCGGPSAEHDISIRSADSLIEWLSVAELEVLVAYWRWDGAIAFMPIASKAARPDEATRLAAGSSGVTIADAVARLIAAVDVVFPIMHGTLGEDGSIQGFLRVLGKPCVGPGVLASALAMDKARTKAVLKATTSLAMPDGETILHHEWGSSRSRVRARLARLALPLIVKPVDGGSSVGLSRAATVAELPPAIERALAVDGVSGALVEELVAGDEVTCALFGNPETGVVALPPILIRPKHGGLFDYQAKYEPGGSEELCPAPLPPPVLRRIEEAAIVAYHALDCRGFARVDFILRDGVPWFLELNTLPGLTRESLFPKAARAAGHSLPELFGRLVELAIARPQPARTATP